MSAYFLFDNLEITEPAKLEAYKAKASELVEKYNGRYAVLGGATEQLEGDWKPNFPVMIEFPDVAQARAWYFSDEYRKLKALRQSAGRFNAVLIDGQEKS